MNSLKYIKISQEAIAFQGDGFLKELALLIEPYIGTKHSKIEYMKLSEAIEKVIKKRTNASIGVDLSPGFDPCIMIDIIDPNSVFSQLWGIRDYTMHNDDSKILKELKTMKRTSGKVDLKNSRLEGVFTMKVCTIHCDNKYFESGKYTSLELAAIFLHEVGHYFGICEYLDRTIATNQILATLDRVLKNTTDVNTRELAIEYAGNALELDERVIEKAKQTKNDSVVSTIFVASSNRMTGEHRSQMGNGFYDLNTAEYTSDEFAARHGAGPYLVTGLDKLMSDSFFGLGPNQKRGSFLFLAMEVIKLLVLSASVAGMMIHPAIVLFGIVFVASDASSLGEPTYDDPITRFRRVRNQLVEMSKIPTLNKEQIAKLLEDIKLVDSVYNQYHERRDFITYVCELGGLLPSAANRDYQKELEKLAMNEFFVKALQFKA